MDWSAIQGDWNRYKVSAKRQWDRLSEQQLAGTRGNREHLASRVREAYALTREEAERQVCAWQDRQAGNAAAASG